MSGTPIHFEVIPQWAKIVVVLSAVLLGALCVGLAWSNASAANRELAFKQADVDLIASLIRVSGANDGDNSAILAAHSLNVLAHLKTITNYQALGGLATGTGSAFLAVGFALFLLGADGAFQMQVNGVGSDKTALALYATAPGLLCFAIAGAMIALGSTRKHEMTFGELSATPMANTTPSAAAPRPRTLALDSAAREACIDQVLTRDRVSRPKRLSPTGFYQTRAIMPRGRTWPVGSKLRVTFMDGDPTQRNKVREFATKWTQHANIDFQFIESDQAEIRVSFAGVGNWAYIGTDATSVPSDKPTMNLAGLTSTTEDSKARAIVLHEFGHAIGLEHEHRPPIDGVRWDRELVNELFAAGSEALNREDVNTLFFERYSGPRSNSGNNVDSESIMTLPIPSELTLNSFSVDWRTQLSDRDVTLIRSAIMYPGRQEPTNSATLKVEPGDGVQ